MPGDNIFKFKVTSVDGNAEKTYTIHVYRPNTNDADLYELTSDITLNPAFNSSVTTYTANVPYEKSDVTLTAVLSDLDAKVSINGQEFDGKGTSTIPLIAGSNTITISTTAKDGVSAKTYTLTVTRAVASQNADLSALAVLGYSLEPIFQSGVRSYSLPDVGYATTELKVTPTTADSKSNVEVRINGGIYAPVQSGSSSNSLALNVGSNIIEVKVTAQSGLSSTYTISVNRKSNNAELSGLTISPGNLKETFASSHLNYTVADATYATDTLTVTPKLVDTAKAKVRIRVNEGEFAAASSGTAMDVPLAVGSNTIHIEVQAEDPTYARQYTIKVNRLDAGKPELVDLVIVGTEMTLNFSRPLLHTVTDTTYYSVYNVTRDVPLTVEDIEFDSSDPSKVAISLGGLVLPGDKLEILVAAGAVTGANGIINDAATETLFYGSPIEQLRQRLADLDTNHDGIHLNEVIAYMNSPHGLADLNGDGIFDHIDLAIVLGEVQPKFTGRRD